MGTRSLRGGSFVAAALCVLSAAACKGKPTEALAKAEPNAESFANVPPPAADGPKLVALRPTAVYEVPKSDAKKLGELGLGSAVARSRDPLTRTGCERGWFAVRPRGFVCADQGVSLDDKTALLTPAAPSLERALPYRFARAKVEGVPLYGRLPSVAEQLENEPDLAKHPAKPLDNEPLGASANDVPLDAHFVASGPPVLLPTGEGIEAGKRTTASFFGFAKEAAPPMLQFATGVSELKAGVLRKQSGVAVTSAFTAPGPGGARHFGITPEGLAVPLDRLKPTLGSTWHGIDLESVGLPIAFIHKSGVHAFSLHHAKAQKHDDELDRRTAVPLSGKFRTVEGVKYEETREGEWLRAQDLVLVVKRSKFPEFAHGKQKWIDVSIANQTLTAYEGQKAVYATLVSTGRDQLKDPATSASTARGVFKVVGKRVRAGLDPREVQGAFDVGDAPWSLDLEGGEALVGAYWGDGIGEAQSFHDVLMTPIDAHRIWGFAEPELPEGWSSVVGEGDGTLVNIRP